jgi:hypothetical protein
MFSIENFKRSLRATARAYIIRQCDKLNARTARKRADLALWEKAQARRKAIPPVPGHPITEGLTTIYLLGLIALVICFILVSAFGTPTGSSPFAPRVL